MLETPAHAQARGVKSLAVLCSLACVADTPQADSADGSREAQEGILRAVLQQAGITPEEVTAVCVDAPRARLEKMAARICPGWLDRRMSVAGMTGHMEGAQILADLAAAWRAPYTADSPRYVLGLVSSQGLTCAAVFCTKKD
jgi:3-oxoacyl-(acyl-carrier-protein) synthase